MSYFILIIVVGIGAYLRFNNLVDDMKWIDGARDVYVAKTIWQTRDLAKIAPLAGAGAYLLFNSPVYYYLLAGVWGVVNSVDGMVGFFALSGVITVVVAYLIGRNLFHSNLAGLLLASMISFNPVWLQRRSN